MTKQSLVDTDEIPLPPPRQGEPQTISSLVEVDLGGLSDRGKVRANNEDAFVVARCDRTMRALLTNLSPGEYPAASAETSYGMLVADGMGGHAGGEVASRTAVRVLLDLVLQTPDWVMRITAWAGMPAGRSPAAPPCACCSTWSCRRPTGSCGSITAGCRR
jgi:protein phosphatase